MPVEGFHLFDDLMNVVCTVRTVHLLDVGRVDGVKL